MTSPFTKKTAPTENTTSAPTPATPASSEWLFSTEDEGEGGQKICYAGTKAGNIKVGFMGSPGEDLIGYVDGLVDGNTIATWRVDGGMPDSLIGAPSDYSGWTEFTVSKELVEEAAHGSELAITASGKQVVVSLKGAADAIPAFNACLGKAPAKSASSSSAAPTEATKKTFRSCLLQVDGKKIIDGACSWEPYGNIGSDFVMEADGYFALLLAENETTATGYWNGERNAGHAHADLGKLRKSGNCWAGPKARLCLQQ